MLIVMIILTVLAIILGILTVDRYELTGFISFVGTVFLGVADVIIVIAIIVYFVTGITAKDKIKMYQKENKKIETQINELVKNYMQYEGETLKEFKNESSITLVSLYPDLKSDKLVEKQIETYTNNNAKIKELEETKIDLKIGKWLLYFGS